MKSTGFFLLRVFIIYIALLLPWPGLSTAYNAWFRSLSRIASVGGAWVVRVEAVPAEEKSPLTTRIHAGNPRVVDSTGKMMGKVLGLDSWGVGWVPTALVVSLIMATSLPLSRRLMALGWGLLLINLYVVFCLRVHLWNGTADLMSAGDVARSISGALTYTLITQMGAGFAVAVVIWLVVTFRSHDVAEICQIRSRIARERKNARKSSHQV